MSTRREQSIGLFREVLRRLVSKRQGGASTHPLPVRVMENTLPGRGLMPVEFIFQIFHFIDLWSAIFDPAHYNPMGEITFLPIIFEPSVIDK